MKSPIVVFSPKIIVSKKLKSPFQANTTKVTYSFAVSKATPLEKTPESAIVTFNVSPVNRSGGKSVQRNREDKTSNAASSFLTPGVLLQRRRSDQDCTPRTANSNSKSGKRNSIRPLRASPLISDSPFFSHGIFSASKACQALIHSPCRSEDYRRQRRRLYHQDEHDEVRRKLSLPESGGGIHGTPLGKGGFGSVYIGKYGGKMVAIKKLHNTGQAKNGQGESLCAELNAFRLYHPNIVKILTFSCTGPSMQIVFEYAGRRNLQQLLDDSSAALASSQRILYCQQVGDALRFCHSNRVLHLDVKPSNILVSDDMNGCKLADFGCSRLMLDSSKNAESCLSASTPGTLMYKAPELLRGSSPSPKSDVYSFGYVLWQCATRQSPFEGLNLHTIVFCVVAKGLRPTLKKESSDKLTDKENTLIQMANDCWKAQPDFRPDLEDLCKTLRGYSA